MRACDLSHVEPGEEGVGEMDDPQAEAVAAGALHALDQSGGGERAELTRYGAGRHAGAARDLVGSELSRLGERVEHRDRALGGADAAGGRLTSAGHPCSFVADSDTALLRVQFELLA